MTVSLKQLEEDLRAVVRGRVSTSTLTRGLYATDASPFFLLPSAIVTPLDVEDVMAVVRYAFEHNIPMAPRGAGTGLAGESLTTGIVLDLSVHLRTIHDIAAESVTVEVGLTHAEINAELAKHGRRFAPDPASSASCTLGGMIATNASGAGAFRHGYTRDYLNDLRFICDDGTPGASAISRLDGLRTLLHENRELLRNGMPRTPFNRCGYLLQDVLTPSGLNLTKLLCGSEGTLGIVTEATIRTIRLPGGVCQFVVGFETLEAAVQAGPELRRSPLIVACDVLDQRLLAAARSPLVPSGVAAILMGTIEAETMQRATEEGRQIVELLRTSPGGTILVEPTCDPLDRERIQSLRSSAVSGLYTSGGGARPVAFVEDIGVPAEALPEFIGKAHEILRTDEVNASFLIHLLSAQVHARPILNTRQPAEAAKMWPLAEKLHALTLELGGTISTQHGTGLARTPWVEKQYGPLMPLFREVKRIFDPKNILNPGKILGPDPSRPAWPMWKNAETTRSPLLVWNESSPEKEAGKCNGCGDCRPRVATVRMCPIFRTNGEEAATPRAKALLFSLLEEPSQMKLADVQEISRHCVNCKMCHSECSSKVNVPKLMLEAKAAHYEEHGLNRYEWILSRAETLLRFAKNFSGTANLVLRMAWTRWLLEKTTGLSRHRRLPRLTNRSFLSRAWWAGWTKRPKASERRKIAYFVDVFANHCDPLIGEAAVAVLKHHDFDVVVPGKQRGSGMLPLSYGDAEAAREAARYNLRILAQFARDGYTIVCTEPSAMFALTQDYGNILAESDVALVASHTVELMTFLGELHARGELKPMTRELTFGVGHHVPCHVKATGKPAASLSLLTLIPGLTLDGIDKSCSGMAGTWGLSKNNYEASLRAGVEMIAALDRPRILFGSTECSACRLQMQDATGKRTLHPIQYLAMAYGLVPELQTKLFRPLRPRLSD